MHRIKPPQRPIYITLLSIGIILSVLHTLCDIVDTIVSIIKSIRR